MKRTAMMTGLVLAALMTGESAGVADAAVSSPPFLPASGTSSSEECQQCKEEIQQYGGGNQTYVAMWDVYASEGECTPEVGRKCVECDEELGCERDWGTAYFAEHGDAELWLELALACGDCDDEGSGLLVAAVKIRDAGKVAQLIAASNGTAWLNQERAAIQAQGCAGAGGAGMHIAVDAALLAAVSAELELLEAAG